MRMSFGTKLAVCFVRVNHLLVSIVVKCVQYGKYAGAQSICWRRR